jgi:hypothetical protein
MMNVQKLLTGVALASLLSAGAYAHVSNQPQPFAGVATHAYAAAAGHTVKLADTEGVNGDRAKVAETEGGPEGVNGDRARMAETEGVQGDRAKMAETEGVQGDRAKMAETEGGPEGVNGDRARMA